MKRGDLGQPRTGAAGYPDEPGGASEPAITGDDTLREQSAADSAARRPTSEDPGDEAGPRPAAGDRAPEPPDHMQRAVDTAAAIAEETGGLGRLGRPMNRRSPLPPRSSRKTCSWRRLEASPPIRSAASWWHPC